MKTELRMQLLDFARSRAAHGETIIDLMEQAKVLEAYVTDDHDYSFSAADPASEGVGWVEIPQDILRETFKVPAGHNLFTRTADGKLLKIV